MSPIVTVAYWETIHEWDTRRNEWDESWENWTEQMIS